VKTALFSQSLFALPLAEAIEATAQIGFSAIELACAPPHFDLETARTEPQRVAEQIRRNGLHVSALSLFNNFTEGTIQSDQLEAAEVYIRLAPLFQTKILKLIFGPLASGEATEAHWDRLARALARLAGVAGEVGVRLAFETHMRQLTDTLTGARRLLELAPSHTIGLTVDFSNLAFAGEDLSEAVPALADRMYNTHVKNGTLGEDGAWYFHSLDTGLTDYPEVLKLLRRVDYRGYLTVECLEPETREKPLQTAKRDLEILQSFLEKT